MIQVYTNSESGLLRTFAATGPPTFSCPSTTCRTFKTISSKRFTNGDTTPSWSSSHTSVWAKLWHCNIYGYRAVLQTWKKYFAISRNLTCPGKINLRAFSTKINRGHFLVWQWVKRRQKSCCKLWQKLTECYTSTRWKSFMIPRYFMSACSGCSEIRKKWFRFHFLF